MVALCKMAIFAVFEDYTYCQILWPICGHETVTPDCDPGSGLDSRVRGPSAYYASDDQKDIIFVIRYKLEAAGFSKVVGPAFRRGDSKGLRMNGSGPSRQNWLWI
jgi:hypothetical protein